MVSALLLVSASLGAMFGAVSHDTASLSAAALLAAGRGREVATAAPPPPPGILVCPPGTIYGPKNADGSFGCHLPYDGTPKVGVSRSYDCAVREHAWDFARRTLPGRGEFKTVFDALQLSRCGLVPPAAQDVYVAPRFATPTRGAVIFVDANNTGARRGDGSKAEPFSTLRAAVAAAEGKPAATIVLRAGIHYTEGVVLTVLHSGLTIQNFEGENASVSGPCPCL